MADNKNQKTYIMIMIGESKVGKSDIFYHIKHKKYNTNEDEN